VYNFSLTSTSWLHANETDATTPNNKCAWNSFNTLLLIGCLVILTINVLTSFILFRVPIVNIRGRSNPVYLCIRFMNVSDIVQACLMLIMPLFANDDCSYIGGAYLCNFFGMIALFLLIISPLTTILMSFDRLLALYKPVLYRSHAGMKVLRISLQVSIAVVLLISILPLFHIGDYHVVTGRRVCLIDTITDDTASHYYVVSVHILFLIALVLMMVCTVSFQFKLHQLENKKKKFKSRCSSRRTRNATVTTMAICLIFIFCYSPYIVRVLYEITTHVKSGEVITLISFSLAFLQPLINPLVCLFANTRYRKELKIVVHKLGTSEVSSTSDFQTTTTRGATAHFMHGSRNNSQRKSPTEKQVPKSFLSFSTEMFTRSHRRLNSTNSAGSRSDKSRRTSTKSVV